MCLKGERDARPTGRNAYCTVGLALRYRLEHESEPNGSRAKMFFRARSGIVLIN